MIKAIDTIYNGYKFRSRLEARWAVFFDKNGIKWEYEKEGFDLGDGDFYLPDFWLPQVQNWAEVKPVELTEKEMRLCKKLVAGTGFNCLMLVGVPDFIEYNAICKGENWNDGENDFEIINFMLTEEYINSENRFFCMGYPEPDDYEYFGATYTNAVYASRSVRFEHGENGKQ
jgi:hypothetical protein